MNTKQQDPIGQAIQDFTKSKKPFDIIVNADMCDDDIIPIETLFRSFDEMPLMEQKAMQLCRGKILDVGACAGPHSRYLSDAGFNVTAIDTSPGAILYLNEIGINAHHVDFFEFNPKEQFDTILMLMNGIGIAGTIDNIERTLEKAKSLLKPGGQLICDSSDVKFLYEEEDGSFWMNLNAAYYGEFKFKMNYKKIEGPWFNWLYIDYDKLHKAAIKCGFKSSKIADQDHHYLAHLILS